MVMTHTVRPKLSVPGSSIVAGAAMLALLVMPGVACPPDKSEPEPPRVRVAPEPDDSTFDRHMRDQRDDHAAPAPSVRQREQQLRRLEDEARAVRDRLERLGRLEPVAAPAPPVAYAPGQYRVVPDAPVVAAADVKIARAYHMPEGRLHALTTLMSRSDVPVLVSPERSRLVVHATRDQHRTFAAFARMICPEGVRITTEDGEPVADDLFPRPAAIARTPSAPTPPGRELADARAPEGRARSARNLDRAELFAQRAHLANQRRAMAAERDAFFSRAEAMARQARSVEREADKIHDQAERAFDRADDRRDKADASREKGAYEWAAKYAAEADALDAEGETLHRRAEELQRRAEGLERQAEDFERKAEELERRAEELEDRAEAFEDRIEEIEDQLDDHEHDHDHDDDHEDHDH